MIVEYNGQLYKACFSESGEIQYYKMTNGEWEIWAAVEDVL